MQGVVVILAHTVNVLQTSIKPLAQLRLSILGVGDGGQEGTCPLKFGKNIFRAIIM